MVIHHARAASYRDWGCGADNSTDDFSFVLNNVNCPKCIEAEWDRRTLPLKHIVIRVAQWLRIRGAVNALNRAKRSPTK